MNRSMKIILLFAVLIYCITLSFSDPLRRPSGPPAVKGKMDLSSWDFETDGSLPLDGEWECYDGQLLTPADFSSGKAPRPSGYVNLTAPQPLSRIFQPHTPFGVRTYRLTVRVDPRTENLGLAVGNIKMSSRLYYNGFLLRRDGVPERADHGYRPGGVSYEVYFYPRDGAFQIILQTANNENPFYPYLYTLTLGTQKSISFSTTVTGALELCGAAFCLFFGIYLLCFYFMGKRDRLFLFAALIQLGIALLFPVTGIQLLARSFPQLPFELRAKLPPLLLLAVAVFMILYVNEQFRTLLPRLFPRLSCSAFGGTALLILFLPYRFHVWLSIPLYVGTIFSHLYLFFFLIRLYRKAGKFPSLPHQKENQNKILVNLCYLTGLILSLGNNYLYELGTVRTKAVGSIAFFTFLLVSVVDLSLQLTRVYRNLSLMDRAKDEFFAQTSYELKAPLNSILNICASCAESPDGLRPEDASAVQKTARHLLDLVDATSDAILLKNGQMKLDIACVDMKVAADVVCECVSRNFDLRQVEVRNRIRAPLPAAADGVRVRQILFNLVENAVNRTERGTVTISGRCEGAMAAISVEDTGCGIPEELHKAVFLPYRRKGADGAGLGLYLSRGLAERMNGSLTLDRSEPGKGSRFVLRLPACPKAVPSAERRIKTAPAPAHPSSPLFSARSGSAPPPNTVLVVDDERFNLETAFRILHRGGYGVQGALSGTEALQKLESGQIDLVVLDLMMPRRSGLEICREIRKKHSLLELPVLISAVANTGYDLTLGLSAGANDFITKPFEEEELLARVGTLMKLKRSMENAVQNELAYLQAQIKPHFLYNALNTIVSLCYTDSRKAARLLTNFSRYLRLTFDTDPKHSAVPLSRELETVKAYAEIEQARFGDKIRVRYDADPALLGREVPPLCLQPLVENAIRHGLRGKESGGTVTVSARRESGAFVLRVRDDGAGMTAEQVQRLTEGTCGGIGFRNVGKRLTEEKNARIAVESKPGKGTCVTLSFPEPADGGKSK